MSILNGIFFRVKVPFKYETAKPVLYTLFRTKPKTVRKDMIRKGDKFWGSSKKQRSDADDDDNDDDLTYSLLTVLSTTMWGADELWLIGAIANVLWWWWCRETSPPTLTLGRSLLTICQSWLSLPAASRNSRRCPSLPWVTAQSSVHCSVYFAVLTLFVGRLWRHLL